VWIDDVCLSVLLWCVLRYNIWYLKWLSHQRWLLKTLPCTLSILLVTYPNALNGLVLTYSSWSARPENREQLETEIRKAHVICIVYAIDDPNTFNRLPLYWLPYIRSLGVNVRKCGYSDDSFSFINPSLAFIGTIHSSGQQNRPSGWWCDKPKSRRWSHTYHERIQGKYHL
jgi:hypothetical protein